MSRGRWVLLTVIALNVVALIALTFIYPHLMVSPGPLSKGHADLGADCFACHVPLRGAASSRCIACHQPEQIGLRTTKGMPITQTKIKVSFHQQLIEQDCIACHTDHEGRGAARRTPKAFSHALLRPAARQQCASCHAAPDNAIHRNVSASCAQCHGTQQWQPARFDHALLTNAVLSRCESCHRAPADDLHKHIQTGCQSCHLPKSWKPATFDHNKYFVLDRDHNVKCSTCHTTPQFNRYTCYGCHEHRPERVREQHREEGIRNIENCVRCHRSADEHPRSNGARGRNERD